MSAAAWAGVGLSTVGLAVSVWVTWWLHRERAFGYTITPGATPPTDAPRIAVIVPARNEARNIRRLIGLEVKRELDLPFTLYLGQASIGTAARLVVKDCPVSVLVLVDPVDCAP